MEYVRDYTMYAAVFGMFSFVWFGWAQEKPRASWRIFIGLASAVALLVCLVGVYLSVKNWDAPSALSDGTAFRNYLLTVYIEFFWLAQALLCCINGTVNMLLPLGFPLSSEFILSD